MIVANIRSWESWGLGRRYQRQSCHTSQSPPSQSHCWLLYSTSQILSPIQCSSPGDVLHVVGDAGVVVLDVEVEVEVVVLDVEVDIVLPVPPLPATARKVLSTSISPLVVTKFLY